MLAGNLLDLSIYIIIDKTCMDLRPKKMHERPFRAAKNHVQPLAAQNSFLPTGKKFLIFTQISQLADLQPKAAHDLWRSQRTVYAFVCC